jgi:starvation-inducible outer membrane lipoprotein
MYPLSLLVFRHYSQTIIFTAQLIHRKLLSGCKSQRRNCQGQSQKEIEAFKESETNPRPVVRYAIQWTQKNINVEKERKKKGKHKTPVTPTRSICNGYQPADFVWSMLAHSQCKT